MWRRESSVPHVHPLLFSEISRVLDHRSSVGRASQRSRSTWFDSPKPSRASPKRGRREPTEGTERDELRVLEPRADEGVGWDLHPDPGPHVEGGVRGPKDVVDQLRGTGPDPAPHVQTGVSGIFRGDGVRIAPGFPREDQLPPFLEPRKAQGGANRTAEGEALLFVPPEIVYPPQERLRRIDDLHPFVAEELVEPYDGFEQVPLDPVASDAPVAKERRNAAANAGKTNLRRRMLFGGGIIFLRGARCRWRRRALLLYGRLLDDHLVLVPGPEILVL